MTTEEGLPNPMPDRVAILCCLAVEEYPKVVVTAYHRTVPTHPWKYLLAA